MEPHFNAVHKNDDVTIFIHDFTGAATDPVPPGQPRPGPFAPQVRRLGLVHAAETIAVRSVDAGPGT